MAKQKLTEDFKKMIVDLYNSGQSVGTLAREYGISEQSIYRWKKLYTPNEESGVTQADLLKLQKEMAQLKEENQILKKALTIFAKK